MPSHYLNQCCIIVNWTLRNKLQIVFETQTFSFKKMPSGMSAILSRPQGVNSLRPRQIRRHFADDVFKCNFLNDNVWILIKISLKFVPKGPINNIPALDQIMVWRRPGDKPLSEPMMVSLLTHICVTRPQWVKPSRHLIIIKQTPTLNYLLQPNKATWIRSREWLFRFTVQINIMCS